MVSGDGPDYQQEPFNLATMGYRQPGSSFKVFTLAAALSKGLITPYTEFDSHQLTINFVHQHGNAFYAPNGTGRFPVHNFGNVYSGEIPMTVATATSDNSVFAQLGTEPKVGTAAVANYARLMGIRSPISTNPSMILGGLKTGVTALDMAHAYSTVANGGVKVFNPKFWEMCRAAVSVGIDSISNCGQVRIQERRPSSYEQQLGHDAGPDRVLPPGGRRPRSPNCSMALSTTVTAPAPPQRSQVSTSQVRRAPRPTTSTPGSSATRHR